MKALFVHSAKFKKYNDLYYSRQFSYEIWKERYLRYVNELHIVGRVEKISSIEGYNISSGENVYHKSVPNIMSPIKLLKDRNKIFRKIENYILEQSIDIVIARIPSEYSLIAIKIANKLGIKVIVEMVGDPFEALWHHGSVKGKVYAPFSYLKYKSQLKKVKNIIFVTEYYLQEKYKPDFKQVNTTNISNVDLTVDENFDIEKKKINKPLNNGVVKISTIGDFTSKYKDIDTAINFISGMRKLDYNVHLYILGKGEKALFSKTIDKYNIGEYIHFTPQIKGGEEVLKWLDNFDLYIHPSLTEGLPRALIEAMSRGLPSIGTKVGGIPELLDKKMLVDTKSPDEIISIADDLLNDKDFYNEQVEANYKKSKFYYKNKSTEKRDKFWGNLLH